MAAIRPFRAWRYHPATVGAVERLMAPLDDDPTRARLHYRLSEHALHLAAPRSLAQALDRLQRWRGQGVLARDPMPALYPYSQRYTVFGENRPRERKGLVALLRLDDPADAPTLLPHEGTLDAPVAQLTELIAATQLNVTPIHALIDEAGAAPTSRALDAHIDAALEWPLIELTDSHGVTHRLGLIQHRAEIRALQELLAGQTLILADGHHRLAASLRHRDLLAQQGPLAPLHPARYVLAFCSTTGADQQSILPFHRAVRLPRGLDAEALITRLSEWFTLSPLEARAPMHEVLRAQPHRIGLVVARQWQLLTLKPDADPTRLLAPLALPASVAQLDYTLLHYLVFDRILGIPYGEQAGSDALSYHKDLARAVEVALYRPHHAAFLMPEAGIADLRAVVNDRALMPPKSTYFAPKVLAGMVFADLADDLADTPFDLD